MRTHVSHSDLLPALGRQVLARLLPLLLAALLGSFLPACDGGGGGAAGTTTYWGAVAPIYYQKCVRCHQDGGIGPFPLDNYPSAKAHATTAKAAVEEERMPPYFIDHGGSCGEFQDGEAVTEAEKAVLAAWVAAGSPEGEKVALGLPALPRLGEGTDYKTPDFAPQAQGGSLARDDEYRCFALDAGLPADAFITGYEVVPGNALLVHHAILFTVDPAKVVGGGLTNAAVMAALDAESPDRAGWPCFGAAGDGIDVEAVPVTWAPGQGVVEYPAGMGVRLAPTEKLVVQIHYNLSDPTTRGMRDQTTVRLRFANTVERRLAFLLPDAFLDSLGEPTPATLPPGQASTKYTWTQSARQLGLEGLPYADIVGVMPHMHERGNGLELRHLTPEVPEGSCVARVKAWDFHWQKMYSYETPIRLGGTSGLRLTCDYDTRGATEPVLPGWGTQNEMCLTVLMVALPPGS
jgi:hypothetical protein